MMGVNLSARRVAALFALMVCFGSGDSGVEGSQQEKSGAAAIVEGSQQEKSGGAPIVKASKKKRSRGAATVDLSDKETRGDGRKGAVGGAENTDMAASGSRAGSQSVSVSKRIKSKGSLTSYGVGSAKARESSGGIGKSLKGLPLGAKISLCLLALVVIVALGFGIYKGVTHKKVDTNGKQGELTPKVAHTKARAPLETEGLKPIPVAALGVTKVKDQAWKDPLAPLLQEMGSEGKPTARLNKEAGLCATTYIKTPAKSRDTTTTLGLARLKVCPDMGYKLDQKIIVDPTQASAFIKEYETSLKSGLFLGKKQDDLINNIQWNVLQRMLSTEGRNRRIELRKLVEKNKAYVQKKKRLSMDQYEQIKKEATRAQDLFREMTGDLSVVRTINDEGVKWGTRVMADQAFVGMVQERRQQREQLGAALREIYGDTLEDRRKPDYLQGHIGQQKQPYPNEKKQLTLPMATTEADKLTVTMAVMEAEGRALEDTRDAAEALAGVQGVEADAHAWLNVFAQNQLSKRGQLILEEYIREGKKEPAGEKHVYDALLKGVAHLHNFTEETKT